MLRNRKYRHPILRASHIRGLHGIRVQASDMMVGADWLEGRPIQRTLSGANDVWMTLLAPCQWRREPNRFAVIKLQCPIRMELAHNVNLEVA